ncbi:MAG: hypothetical protein ABSB49_00330 [Polyangia bacterium]
MHHLPALLLAHRVFIAALLPPLVLFLAFATLFRARLRARRRGGS